MNVSIVPLNLRLGDREYVDDSTLNIEEYLEEMKQSKDAPKSSSPAPHEFLKRYEGNDVVFVVTLSSRLSGTYNSAVLAANMFMENEGHKKYIHVFDSLSASSGETAITIKIHELIEKNFTKDQIVEEVNQYIQGMKTLFLLESLDHLEKAGRLSPIAAKIASILSVKPIMGSDGDGNIRVVEKVMGYRKGFRRFVEIIGEEGTDFEEKVLSIAHCNCYDRALQFKEQVVERYNFKDIVIVAMAGLSSSYADEGGLVVAF